MKKLTNLKAVRSGTQLTITATIADAEAHEFKFPVERRTILLCHEANPKFPKHLQMSDEAVFVKAYGFGLAITSDDIMAIAAAAEPNTASPPVIKGKIAQDLTADVSSELAPDFKWQLSNGAFPMGIKPNTPPPEPVWTDIAGASAKTLDKSLVKSGQWVRCIISSQSGSITSNPVQVA